MSQEKHYQFTITINGDGENVNEAWLDAITALNLDPGPTPDKSEYEIIDLIGKEIPEELRGILCQSQ